MKNHRLATKRSNSGILLCATAVAALTTGQGCANEADDEGESDVVQPATLALQATSGQTTLRDPNGTYFANITANGTGCPAGSWKTSISEDGQTFTTTFSDYQAEVDTSDVASAKDCYLSMKLNSPAGLSYAVTSFHYSGYAYLQPGVKARQTASYYFQGNPVDQTGNRTELVGPYDDTYLFSDEIKTSDQVWSPCGKERDLQVVTRLRVENSSPRGAGYANLTAIDATTRGKVILKLGLKKCDGTPVGTPSTPVGTPSNPSSSTPGGTPSNPGSRPPNPVGTPPVGTPPVGTPPRPGTGNPTPWPGSTTTTGPRVVREGSGPSIVSVTPRTPVSVGSSGGGPSFASPL